MNEVIIDGVRYLPATKVLANELTIARGLLEQFWGPTDDKGARKLIDQDHIRVLVSDSISVNQGQSLREILDTITEIAQDDDQRQHLNDL